MARQLALTHAPLPLARHYAGAGRRAVTPNRRAAQAVGAGEALSLAELGRRLLRGTWQPAPEPVAARELTATVQHLLHSPHAARQAAVMRAGLARLLRAGADLDRLRHQGSDRVRLLARVALEYRQRLASRGLVDEAELLHVAAREVTTPDPLLVYGYARLDADERAFLKAYAADGSVLVLPGGAKTMFDENRATADELLTDGWELLETVPDGALSLGERVSVCWMTDQPCTEAGVVVYDCADPEDEVRAALAEVKRRLLAGVPAKTITVVTRDEDRYAPLVMKVAAEFAMPVHPQTSGPLTQTRLGAYLTRLLTIAVERAPYETTLRAFTDPLAGSLRWDQLDAARTRRAQGFDVWREILAGSALLDLLADTADRSMAEWIAWLREVLKESKLPARLLSWPRELIAWSKLQDGLQLLDGDEQPLGIETFAMAVADLAGAYAVKLDPSRGGVALHTPLALYGSRYDEVYVLGTAAGQLPARLHEDPFLDTHERAGLTALGVRQESAVEQALRERLSFWMMLQSAERRLVFCRPRVIDRAVTEPSPFLAKLDLPVVTPAPILAGVAAARVYELAEPVTAEACAARHGWEVECRRESSAAPDEFDGVLGEPVALPPQFSVSSLVALGQCPFKWLARYAWRLGPLDETPAEPDAGLLGSLYHGVLELVVKAAKAKGYGTAPAAMLTLLEPALAAQLGEQSDGSEDRAFMDELVAAREPTGHEDDDERRQAMFRTWSHWPILRAEVRQFLSAVIACDDFLKDVAEPDAFEFGLAGTFEGLPVRGRVDRADILLDGGRRLLDYKSGGSSRPLGIQGATGKLDVDVQLPLYAALYAAQYGVEPEVAYFKLGARKLLGAPKDADLNQALVAEFARDIPNRLAAGRLPVAPDVKGEACRWCDFESLCRLGPRLARKGVV